MKQILMTKVGFENLLKEKQELEKNRSAAVEDLKKAREMGDLSENGYYKAARAKLSSIDARLRYLTNTIRFAKVEEVSLTNIVNIGTTVHLEGKDGEIAYMIVGEHEANPSEKKISYKSPLGQVLMNKKVGEEAHLITSKGKMVYKIKNIS